MQYVVPNNAMLIPGNATRAFHGEIFDVYQWPQQLYDGSTVTYEMLRRPDTVQIIAIKDNKIVVLDEQQSGRPAFVRLPGGRVESGESRLAAGKRECLEELGMRFANWRLISVCQPIVKIEWFVATYLATDLIDEQSPELDAGEHIRVLAASLSEWKQRLAREQSPLADYAKLVFESLDSLEQLLHLPEFQGQTIDRP